MQLSPRQHWSSLLLAALALAASTGSPSAQQAAQRLASGNVEPRSIQSIALGHPAPRLERHTVWLRVPRRAGASLDVDLLVEPRPALLTVSVPPTRKALVPGSVARFDISFEARPAFRSASFELVFREHRSGITLGNIPVLVERGVGAAPRNAKEAALETLRELRDEVAGGAFEIGDRDKAVEELEDAIEELEESLAAEFWARLEGGDIDPEHLDPERGAHVFNEERESAQEIFDTIRQGKVRDEELSENLLGVIDSLVAADRRLAEIAIQEAEETGGQEEELDEARTKLQEGDVLVARAAGQADLHLRTALLYTAMDGSYRHAWDAAIDSLED
jgi:hypothetical protein